MPDLLLEVLSEEIPARMQAGGAQELEKQVCSRLKDARLAHEGAQTFATPRRLALIVPGLPPVQPDVTVERKGPRVNAPEKAIAGFLRSTGLTLDDCEQRETPKGPVWFAVKQEKGRPTGELLAELLPEALAAVSWPKSMRWDESGVRWVRPIRSILCLLDDAVVPFRFGAIESGRTTLGHRFLSSGTLSIADAYSYEAALEDAKVMLSPKARAQTIRDKAVDLAKHEGLYFLDDKGLVDENAGLVEWPVVSMGHIDAQFMDLPAEVLRSAMGTHQRYFGVVEAGYVPTSRFVMVANTETSVGATTIIAGNERVLRARLADARFFWDQDRSQSLEKHGDALKGVVFHARLGSMYEKARRVAMLANTLAPKVVGANPEHAARAGLLCKADLVTEMVGEFPELQGIMGGFYAAQQVEPEHPEVYGAIRNHYLPKGPDDPIPMEPVTIAVALADKLDTLAGFFAIDEQPTGSKDPFALRRAALGVIGLVIENSVRLPLKSALAEALAGYGNLLPEEPGPQAARGALLAFFADRVRAHWREQGIRHDLVNAVFGVEGEDDLVRLMGRVDALAGFVNTLDGANLLTAYRRAANILRVEEKKDGVRYDEAVVPALYSENEEHALHNHIAVANDQAEAALARESFSGAMVAIAKLRAPVDAFFDNVTVNCEDPTKRRNRLRVLSQIRSTLDRVADFSKIEG